MSKYADEFYRPKRAASMIPVTERAESAGEGLGQQTGSGSAPADGQEARKLLAMITPVGREMVELHCGSKAAKMVAEETERSNAIVTHYTVTGRQLFWLRDIKDRLVERGIL